MAIDDVDTHHGRRRKELAETASDLSGAAPGVEDSATAGQSIAAKQVPFLRPDRFGLGGQISHHRFVGHLSRLWVQLVHPRPRLVVDCHGMPFYSYIGMVVLSVSEAAMFARIEPFWSWHPPIALTGYILNIEC